MTNENEKCERLEEFMKDLEETYFNKKYYMVVPEWYVKLKERHNVV